MNLRDITLTSHIQPVFLYKTGQVGYSVVSIFGDVTTEFQTMHIITPSKLPFFNDDKYDPVLNLHISKVKKWRWSR
jgi:hypothetical protein